MEPLKKSKNLLSSLNDALNILEVVAYDARPFGISEISRMTGYPKSKVHRVFSTLARRGYVRKDSNTGRYQLTLRFLEIGGVAVNQLEIKQVARPYLEKLRDLSGEAAHLAVMDEEGVFYIDKIESAQSIRMYSYIGGRAPIHCTAVGKVLLAHQPAEKIQRVFLRERKQYTSHTILDKAKLAEEFKKIRRHGFALDNEELEIGLFCVAAPIRNYSGSVIAAVSISGPGVRLTRSKIKELIPLVIKTGAELSADLGYGVPEKIHATEGARWF